MINELISNPNGQLDDKINNIRESVHMVRQNISGLLDIKDNIDILFTSAFRDYIPEDGIGGRTYTSDFVSLSIDADSNISTDVLQINIAHEISHATRWQNNWEQDDTLLKGLLFEGIAVAFSLEYASMFNINNRGYFVDTILNTTEDESNRIMSIVKDDFEKEDVNYWTIFFNGNDQLPRWAGYRLGYYLVNKYLDISGQKAHEIISTEYQVISDALRKHQII